MIDLTPLDVRKKKEDFKKALRGYDPDQVGAFLDLVADRMEELVREQRSLSDKVESLREQLGHYQEREKALNEALLAAQELREEARSQAERDAAVRLREAETHAEAILLEADQALRHSQRRLEDVRTRRGQLIRSLKGVAHRLLGFLEEEEQRLITEPDDLGDLLEKLDTEMAAHAELPEGAAPASTPSEAADPATAAPPGSSSASGSSAPGSTTPGSGASRSGASGSGASAAAGGSAAPAGPEGRDVEAEVEAEVEAGSAARVGARDEAEERE